MPTNPNGANQYNLDPRQKLCWESYINPKSETFGNARQSALKAGYEDTYARTITDTEWFYDKIRRLNMLSKAEKVLDKTLDLPAVDEEGKVDVALLRVQTDVSKHITNTLGKHEGYTTKTETDVTSNGEALQPILVKFIDNENNRDTD
jgi:hypothetical protein